MDEKLLSGGNGRKQFGLNGDRSLPWQKFYKPRNRDICKFSGFELVEAAAIHAAFAKQFLRCDLI